MLGGLPFAPKPRPHLARILALDPGPTQTGYVAYYSGEVFDSGVAQNADVINLVRRYARQDKSQVYELAVEMIASYGMPVGREVFETCVWIGRFMEAWHTPDAVELVYRKDVKMHLCGTPRAKDGNVRQALIDLYPATGGGATPQIGTKAKPGPLYGVSTHAWPALGVAVTVEARHAAVV